MSMTTGRIVVGVDDSEENIAALVWAIRQARASGATIEAVYAFQVALPVPYSPTVRAPADEVAAEAQAALDQVIAARLAGHPDVKATTTVIEGRHFGRGVVRDPRAHHDGATWGFTSVFPCSHW